MIKTEKKILSGIEDTIASMNNFKTVGEKEETDKRKCNIIFFGHQEIDKDTVEKKLL